MDLFRAHIKTALTLSQNYYQTIVNTFLRFSMDTWRDRKFSKRKFPSNSEKSYHAHIIQIIFPSTVLEFTLLVIDGFMEDSEKWFNSSPHHYPWRGGVQTMIVYSKIVTLVKAAFFRWNSMIQLNYKKQAKQDWYFDKVAKDLVIIPSSVWTR